MHCADIARLLSEGHSAAELRRRDDSYNHIAICHECRDIVDWAATPLAEPSLPEPIIGRIRSIVHTGLAPVRPLPSLLVILPGVFALTCLVAGMLYPLFGARGWQAFSFLELALLTALAALVLSSATVSLLASIRPAAKLPIHPLVPIVLHAAGFPILVAILFPARPNAGFYEEGIVCLTVGLALSAVAACITLLFARRGYSTEPPRTGALIGAVAGVAGSIGLQMSCPDHEFAHMAVWHGLVIIVPIAAGYLVACYAGVLSRSPSAKSPPLR